MKIKDKVEYCLKHEKFGERCRNSDRSLIMNLWYNYHPEYFKNIDGKLFLDAEKIFDLPSTESIRRCRQKFQEEGQYLPSDPIIKSRRGKEKNVRDSIAFDIWDQAIEEII